MDERDEDAYLEAFQSFFREARKEKNFLNFLDARLTGVQPGRVELYVPSSPYLFNPGGVVHGAVTAGLVDMACGLTIRSELGPPARSSFQTIDLNVSWVARAEVQSDAPDGTRKTVVSGQATYCYDEGGDAG